MAEYTLVILSALHRDYSYRCVTMISMLPSIKRATWKLPVFHNFYLKPKNRMTQMENNAPAFFQQWHLPECFRIIHLKIWTSFLLCISAECTSSIEITVTEELSTMFMVPPIQCDQIRQLFGQLGYFLEAHSDFLKDEVTQGNVNV